MMKKHLFVVPALLCILVLILLSTPVFAADNTACGTILWYDENANETCVSWMAEDGILVIEKGDSSQVDGASFCEADVAKTLTDAVIAEDVPFIGSDAFAGCNTLESLTIPASVIRIAPRAFAGCENLKIFNPDAHHVYYTEPDTSAPDKNFLFAYASEDAKELIAYPSAEGEIVVPEDIKVIGAYAFSKCQIESVYLPEGVTDIGEGTFYECGLLSRLDLPASIKTIGKNAFPLRADSNALHIFYAGTQEDWDNIQTAPQNDGLLNAVITGANGTHIQAKRPKTVFTIALDANGGICSPSSLETDNQGMLSASALPLPSRTGYSFAGWYTEKEGGERMGGESDTLAFAQDNTFYAHWIKDTGAPEQPDTPDEPNIPDEPDTPDTPDMPSDPDLPTTPSTPDEPSIPKWFNTFRTPNQMEVQENPAVPKHSHIYIPSTPPTKENLAKDHWESVLTTHGFPVFRHLEPNGTPSSGSRYIETSDGAGVRYIFHSDGTVAADPNADLANACIQISLEGDVLAYGHLYYLNPDRDENDPRTCFVMTNYLRVRDNCAGQTYYDQNGIAFVGWIKSPGGGLRYQARIPQPGKVNDLYLIVWRVQTLPASPHPDDPAHIIPAGRYFFDDAGFLVQKEGWHDGKDGKEYYTNNTGLVMLERALL